MTNATLSTAPAGVADYLAPRTSLLLAYTFATAIFVSILFALQYHAPVAYVALITENYWGENATFFCYVGTSVIVAILAVGGGAAPRRGVLIMIAVICLFVAMEEISWGMWIHKIEPPEWLARRNMQNEMNLHNLEGIAEHKMLAREIVAAFLVAWSTISAALVIYRDSAWLDRIARFVPLMPLHIAPAALATAWLMASEIFIKSEEIAELALALLALLWATDLYTVFGSWRKGTTGRIVRSRATGIIVVSALTVLFSQLANHFFPDSISGRLTRTAARDYPDRGLLVQSHQIFDYLFRNPRYFSSGTLDQYDAVIVERDSVSEPPIILFRPGEVAAFYEEH